MKSKIVLFGIIVFCSYISLLAQSEEFLFSPKGIAEIHITLADGKHIGDIKNEKWNNDYAGKVKANMLIKNSASSTYDSKEFYNGKILIDGRGNTSWHRDKRPYNIDLTADDWETKISRAMLGMPGDDEWCLLAFWNDRSLMRVNLASYLGQYLNGMMWTPRCRYVEVWINGDYRGLYVLSEKIQRSASRIDIKKLDAASTDLSGGYIIENEPEDGHKSKPIEMASQFKTKREGINFIFKYPKPKNVTSVQRTWIMNHMNEFEDMLASNNFKDPVTGYLKYINENSFIDWTILHELSKGCDNLFHASNFVHKDRNGKLNMSAPWDFDLSFGNSGIYTEDETWVRTHRWFNRLYQDQRYAEKFNKRYDEMQPLFNRIPEILQANYRQLEASGVLDREFNRFPQILTDFVSDGEGRRTPTTYQGHVQWLSEWTMSRNNWVYISLGLTNEEKGQRMEKIKPVIRVMDPEGMKAGKAFEVKVMKSNRNGNAYTYSWNDAAFNSSDTKRISTKGKYWVKIMDGGGNISLVSDTLYVGVEAPPPTAIQTPEANPFFTFTNPAKDFLEINYLAVKASDLFVQLIDLKGMIVKKTVLSLEPGCNRIEIPVFHLARGIYLLRLQTENGTVSKKMIIQ